MTPGRHQLAFDGAILAPGFWLYIWEVTAADGAHLLLRQKDRRQVIERVFAKQFPKLIGPKENYESYRSQVTRFYQEITTVYYPHLPAHLLMDRERVLAIVG